MRLPRVAALLTALLLLAAPARALSPAHVAIVASADAAIVGAARPIAMPRIMAWPGGLGMPRVITWADTTGASGLAWGTTSQITAANPYVTYDGTDLVINTITGKGVATKLNGNLEGMHVAGNGVIDYGGITTAARLRFFINGQVGMDLTSTAGSANPVSGHLAVPALQWVTSSFAATPAGTEPYLNYDGTSLIANVPSNKSLGITINGSGAYLFGTSQLALNGSALSGNLGVTAFDASRGAAMTYGSAPAGGVITGRIVDGATAVALAIESFNTLATAGAKIATFTNGGGVAGTGTEILGVKWDSGLTFSNTIAPAAADYGIGQNGSNLVFGAPTSKGFLFTVNAVTTLADDSLGAMTLTPAVGAGVGLTLTAPIQTSGATGYLTVTGAASTAQTASTEVTFANFNFNQTVTWAPGAISAEREFIVQAGQLNFSSGSNTVTTASTFYISGAPRQGTNAIITNAFALNVNSGASSFGGPLYLGGGGTSVAITADASAIDATKRYQLVKPSANSAVTINTLTGGSAGQEICLICDTSGGGGSTTLTINNTATNTVNSFRQPQGLQSQTIGNAAHQPCGCYVFGAFAGEANNQWWAEW